MKVITVCGSVRFKEGMLKYREEQHKIGNWVLLPENMDIDIQKIDTRVKELMDGLHLSKITCADIVLIWNQDDYIGESTKAELKYAIGMRKEIEFLEKRNMEYCFWDE